MKPFPKKYEPKEIEKKWQDFWQENKTYKWDSSFKREDTFVIDTPPPTVSGLLHMGHIFSYTQADLVARYKRMSGKTVFYPIGFDDNGLPTERLVEKQRKVRGYSMNRAEFVSICKEVVAESEEEFTKLFKSIALSTSPGEEYQTISDRSKTLSQMSFLEIVSKGEAYRKLEPVLWDIVDATALSQADIEDIELSSHMNYVKFALENSKEEITIATSRPELLPACVAMFVNPEDKRFKHLIGTNAITPLFGIKVPILADDRVDIEKGTGAVMCCTFGDITDVYWWKKYQLNTKMIIAQYGKILELEDILPFKDSINSAKAKEYAAQIENLKIDAARQKIIEILRDEGLLLKQEDITHPVKCGERSKAPIEILISNQWFIKVLDKKQALIEKANECVWYPPYMKTRLEIWVNGLSFDWCISRQRFFGVPFPIWYSKRKGEEGKVLTPSLEDLPVDPLVDLPKGYTREEVEADKDVMDTWATSSISPQLNSHAITKEFAIDYERHKQLYPADLRPQAHEIIRTWTFSTIVKSLIHENSIPWKNLMISGWCLAADKTKMSKSKGNIVTPINLIEEKGADTIRYWTATSKLGSDIAYSEDVFANGKRLINKLWNAASFASIHLANIKGEPETVTKDLEKKIIFEEMDKWALLKLREAIERATSEFEEYEYSIARQAIENFFWKDFCDNYLEIAKARAYNEDGKNPAGQQSAIFTIHHIMKTLLLLFAPFVPHITEEISHLLWEGDSIHGIGTWPKLENFAVGNSTDESGDAFIAILDMIRKLKADKQVSIRAPIANLQIASGSQNAAILASSLNDFANVVNAEKISISNDNSGYLETEGGKFYLKVDFA